MPKPGRLWEYRGYWIGKEPGSPAFYIYWREPGKRTVRRSTLGAPSRGGPQNLDEAIDRAEPWVKSRLAPERKSPAEVFVGTEMENYLIEHAANLKSGSNIARRIQIAAPEFAESTFASLTLERQWEFIGALHRGRGYKPAYIALVMKAIQGVASHAYKKQRLMSYPHIITSDKEIADHLDAPAPVPRDRILTIEEIAMLFEWVDEEHLFRFLFLDFATAARPEAVTDLTLEQMNETDRFIDLNPPGRRQTHKHRPVVPMIQAVADWLPYWRLDALKTDSGRRILHRRGEPVKQTKKGVKDLAARIGLPGVTRYTIRHTVATYLRRQGVPKWEVEGLLGHKGAQSETDVYAKYDPDYLSQAAQALDSLFLELSTLVKGRFLAPKSTARKPTALKLLSKRNRG